MKAFQSVIVGQVRSLEVGDVFAMSFLGGVVSGKVTGVPYSRFDLTLDQLKYMKEWGLSIPEGDRFTPLTSSGERLIFGDFVESERSVVRKHHMYVHEDTNVAVFPTNNE